MLLAVGVTLAAAGACTTNAAPAAYGGGPQLQANIDSGIARLASAKCDRALRCGGIGPRASYDTREQCETIMRGKISDDIGVKNCRGGFDEGKIEKCMASVRSESCNNPIEDFSSHIDCRVSKICFQ